MDDFKRLLESFGYKLVSRFEFEQATDRPEGLLERASPYQGSYVVYDPHDDDEGFMLIGDEPNELAKKAWEHLDIVGAFP